MEIINKNFVDFLFIKNLKGVRSPTFKNKESDNVLSIVQIEDSLDINSTDKETIEFLSNDIDSNPDGVLLFIESQYSDDIQKIIQEEFINAFNYEELNFTNGEVSETILFYNVKEGLILEFVDPECFSDFFQDLIHTIKSYFKAKLLNDDLLVFDVSHMSSNIGKIKDVDGGPAFLKILKNNDIDYNEYQ